MLCCACPELVLCYHEVCLAAPNSKPLGSMDQTPKTILIVGEMKVYSWDNKNVWIQINLVVRICDEMKFYRWPK